MRKTKTRSKKRKVARNAPRPVVNPAWLHEDPVGKAPSLPVRTRPSLLPFHELTPQDFERLCLRLSERGGKAEGAWSYGKSGHSQHGIDVLVRVQGGDFHVWQSKRHKKVTKGSVKEAVRFFLNHKWAKQARRFVLAVACNFDSPSVVEAIETARTELEAKNVEFEALDASKLTQRLKSEPDLADDFFGREWVEPICGLESTALLENRLSRFDMPSVRTRLRGFYNSWISAVDPGLPIVARDAQGRMQASIPITERYIQPDLIVPLAEAQIAPASAAPRQDQESRKAEAESGRREPKTGGEQTPVRSMAARERRIPLDEYLKSQSQALIVGEAGSGKSSLLRFVALDILADAPVLNSVKERFATCDPGVVTVRAVGAHDRRTRRTGADRRCSFEFFRSQGDAELAEDMRRAVCGKGIVLLVDGIDEASDATAARSLVAVLAQMADQNSDSGRRDLAPARRAKLWVSSRAAGIAAIWRRYRARNVTPWPVCGSACWKVWKPDRAPRLHKSSARKRKRRRSSRLCSLMPAISRLSQTPLFLLAFLSLHRRGQTLPRNRFAASREIVEQLMEHQPAAAT